MDATSKFLDGDLDGNLLNLGNYDECLSVQVPENIFDGKYCLAFLSLSANTSIYEYLKYMNLQSGKAQYFVQDNVLLFGPEVAMCIPSSCTAEDLQKAMNMKMLQDNLTAVFFANNIACVVDHSNNLDTGDWITIGVLLFFAALVAGSTYYDVTHEEHRQDIFITFSLYTNSKKLLSTKCETYLHCLHGIRFITSMWILVGHVYVTVLSQSTGTIRTLLMLFFFLPFAWLMSNTKRSREDEIAYENVFRSASYIIKDLSTWKKIFITNSYPSVDTFLLLSGLLLSYSFMKGIKNMQRIRDFNIPLFYFVRYVRLTPVLGILILISATVLRRVGSGPMWDRGMYASSELCKESWWKPLLYIQNYLPDPSCMMQSWYLAVDTQLYVLSPIVLILLWKRPRIGIYVLILLTVIGMVIVFCITYVYNEHLPFIEMVREGSKASHIYDEGLEQIFQNNHLFIKTHSRYPPWVIGVLLGYILYNTKDKTIHMSKTYVTAGWICAMIFICGSVGLAHPLLQLNYVYNVWEMAFYLSIHRVTWSIGVAWLIFACASGYGGIINWFLSLPVWLPFSRLVYCMYLIHTTVLQLMSLSLREATPSNDSYMFVKIVTLFITSTVVSVVISLVFESPFIQIINIVFKGRKEQDKRLDTRQNGKTESNA